VIARTRDLQDERSATAPWSAHGSETLCKGARGIGVDADDGERVVLTDPSEGRQTYVPEGRPARRGERTVAPNLMRGAFSIATPTDRSVLPSTSNPSHAYLRQHRRCLG
jgi:hypothetical protein